MSQSVVKALSILGPTAEGGRGGGSSERGKSLKVAPEEEEEEATEVLLNPPPPVVSFFFRLLGHRKSPGKIYDPSIATVNLSPLYFFSSLFRESFVVMHY